MRVASFAVNRLVALYYSLDEKIILKRYNLKSLIKNGNASD
jgi:hypothetical protein